MTLTVNENAVMAEDAAFYRVDTRTPAHELPAGTAADAVNKRFEDGRAWPRHCVNRQPWGRISTNLVSGVYINVPLASQWTQKLITGFTVGKSYFYEIGNSFLIATAVGSSGPPAGQIFPDGTQIQPGLFTATQTSYYVFTSRTFQSATVTAVIYQVPNTLAYKRFNDPNGFDVAVLLTDDWRDGGGEDGGRGRAWRIQSGNAPVEVDMNGHDIWDITRLVPCFNALVMLRQGNERHYVNAAAFASSKIQLNCAPAWVNGDRVLFKADLTVSSVVSGTTPPADNTAYFVKNVGSNQVELYADSGLSTKLVFTSAAGRFYIERQATQPGFYGNGAPPLIAQGSPTAGTLWDVGFVAVPSIIVVTDTAAATDIFTAPNHRFIPGDQVTLAGMTAGHTPANGDYFVFPLNEHELKLYDTLAHALLGGATGLEDISNDHEGAATLVKKSASGLPMPPGREGFYTQNNRLVIVNGDNNIAISDPLDPLHFAPFQASLTANLGESDRTIWVNEISQSDALVFGKENSIIALFNFSQGPTQWVLRSITREYGGIAPLAVAQWGASLLFLSRRGLDRVVETAFGVIQPTLRPVSWDMKKYIDRIDWRFVNQSVLETWNNRLFLSVAAKGQSATGGNVPQNNMVLSLNFLNSDPASDQFGWEGMWQGVALRPLGFARLKVYGEERLTFAGYYGQVFWLGDGWTDFGTAIADSLTTRMYGKPGIAMLWLKGELAWDTNAPSLTVSAQAPGWNEVDTLLSGLTYDKTAYAVDDQTAYDPSGATPTSFNLPYREDYSLSASELTVGALDAHQNSIEPVRMRVDDWGVQLVIANAAGSARIGAVKVEGIARRRGAVRRV